MTPPVLAPPGMLRRIAEAAETPALKMVAGSLAPEIAASIAHAIIDELGIRTAEVAHLYREREAREAKDREGFERYIKETLSHQLALLMVEGATFSHRRDMPPDYWRATARVWVITKGEPT